jgi:hypothetical protein
MLEQLPFFFEKCRQRTKNAKDSEVGTTMVLTCTSELACLLACLRAHNNCLLQTVRAAGECKFLFMLPGRILEPFEPIWRIFRGNLCIVWPHVSRSDPQRFLRHAHQTHPQFSKDRSFDVWDPKKCVGGLIEMGVRSPPRNVCKLSRNGCEVSPKKCVQALKKWVWGLPQENVCKLSRNGCEVSPKKMCARSQEMGVRSPPRKCVQGLKKCERS